MILYFQFMFKFPKIEYIKNNVANIYQQQTIKSSHKSRQRHRQS